MQTTNSKGVLECFCLDTIWTPIHWTFIVFSAVSFIRQLSIDSVICEFKNLIMTYAQWKFVLAVPQEMLWKSANDSFR